MLNNYICIIVIIIILCICLYLWYIDTFNLKELFTTQFFNKIIPTYHFGIDNLQLSGNDFDFIKMISRFVPYNINTVLVNDSINRYNLLNNNQIHMILSRSHELYGILYKSTPSLEKIKTNNIRFVCALYDIPVNILTTDLDFNDFGDLKNSGVNVNIGPINSSEYLFALDIIYEYQLQVGIDIHLTYYNTEQLYEHYGNDVQVAFITCTHPDHVFSDLSRLKLSRIIEINKFNNGNIYQLSLDEQPFFKAHPYYRKNIIEKQRLRDYYPNLVVNEQIFVNNKNKPIDSYHSQFISCLTLTYYLLCNVNIPPIIISQLLFNLKLNMNHVNDFEFIENKLNTSSFTDFTLNLPIHQGASDFYYSSGLYTKMSNQSCLLINGKCDNKQLYLHHLSDKLGP